MSYAIISAEIFFLVMLKNLFHKSIIQNGNLLANFYYSKTYLCPTRMMGGGSSPYISFMMFPTSLQRKKDSCPVIFLLKCPIKKFSLNSVSDKNINHIIIHNLCTSTVSLLINLGCLRLMSHLKHFKAYVELLRLIK